MIDLGLPGEAFRLILRWAHVVAAIAWLGGALFYLVVLRPALRSAPPDALPALNAALARHFRDVVQLGVFILLVSGVVLSVDRLSSGFTGPAYLAVLVLKIALSLLTFWLALEIGRRSHAAARRAGTGPPAAEGASAPVTATGLMAWLRPPRIILALGLFLVLLGLLLRGLFEAALRALA